MKCMRVLSNNCDTEGLAGIQHSYEAVPPDGFVEEMTACFKEHDLPASPALQLMWAGLARVLNDEIVGRQSVEGNPTLTTVQFPPGTGKTLGLIRYCALLSQCPKENHPGVLIACKLIEDVDKTAAEINRLCAPNDIAVPFHSENETSLKSLASYPVVVTTHRTYQLSGSTKIAKYGYQPIEHDLNAWSGGRRGLVVIDEFLSITQEHRLTLQELESTFTAIRHMLSGKYPVELGIVECLIGYINKKGKPPREGLISLHDIGLEGTLAASLKRGLSFKGLRQSLREIRYDLQLDKQDSIEQGRLLDLHRDRIDRLEHIVENGIYCSTVGDMPVFSTSRVIVPEKNLQAIVLDATASVNPVYDLLPNVRRIERQVGVRNYENVSLHCSKNHKVGKWTMRDNGQELCGQFISEMNPLLGGRNVLIVTHKELEPLLVQYEPTFKLHTAHWGAIDGRNDWCHCDTVVIFGLPYRPPTMNENLIRALKGSEYLKEIKNSRQGGSGEKVDWNAKLTAGMMANDIIQAMNRIQCRKMIDSEGNCDQTDVYLYLPREKPLRERILDAIREAMPGIAVIDDWEPTIAKASVKKSKAAAAILMVIGELKPGESLSKKELAENLGITLRTIENTRSRWEKELSSLGIEYREVQKGRTRRMYFIKLS